MRSLKTLRPVCCSIKRYCTAVESRSPNSSVRLSYITYETVAKDGDKTLPPIFIMHGLMGAKTNWKSLSKVLSKYGRKVVSVDARNHGESPHTPDMNYHLMSKDTIDLMDEMGHEKVSLIGHSMGGKAFMSTALLHPDRVDSLIVVDVSPAPSPRAKSLPGYLQCMLKIQSYLSSSDMPVMSIFDARRIGDSVLKEVEEVKSVRQFLLTNLIDKDGKYKWRVNLDSIINNYQAIVGFPEFQGQYEGPTLFVGGADSTYITSSCLPVINRLFPNNEVKHIPDAGHWVHADKPTDFINTVQQFYNKIETSGH